MSSCEIILAGFGGQGILFTGKVLAQTAMLKNRFISWLPSYGPEMRGGTANCHVIISDAPIGSPISINPDILVAMNRPSLDKFEDKVKSGGLIVADSSLVGHEVQRNDVRTVYLKATEIAEAMEVKKLANMVILGALIKETGIFDIEDVIAALKQTIPPKKATLLEPNIKAVTAGYEMMRG